MKVKAVEKLLKFDKNSAGVYRYVMAPELYAALTQKTVIQIIVSVLSAVLTTLTTTSCMGHGPF